MVSSGEGPDEVAPSESQKGDSPDSQTNATKPIHYSNEGIHTLQNQDEIPPCDVPEKALDYAGGRILQLDKEGSVSSITPPKVSQTPGTGSHSLQSGQEGRTPSIMREKVSEDGYHWRKYGQKLVKGNEFVRSYYKCTHPSCHVKKQLECSHDGKITDIVYLGEHEHPKPQLNLPQPAGFVLSVVEEKLEEPSVTSLEDAVSQAPHPIESVNTSQLSTVTSSEDVKSMLSESNRIRDEVDNDDDPRPKRRKKGNCNDDPTTVDKTTGEPRLVVQTLSEVDFVNDGYRWRKYGQKMVKGNPNPRSYYRCSSLGCPVKKHVERASHDPKMVITSYEGQHDHDMPPSRTVTHNTTGLNACTTAIQNGESGAKSGERRPTSLDLVACNTLDSNINLKEKLNSESRSKSEGNNSRHESTSSEQKKSNSGELKESGAADIDMVVNTYSVPVEQRIGESRIEAKENSTACGVRTVTLGPETSPNEHIPNSEPVQS